MGAYDVMDQAFKGMLYGLDNRVETWCCQEVAGVPFGSLLFGYVGDEKNGYLFHNDTSKIAYSTDFIADNSTIVTVNGVATAPVVFDTTHLITVTALVAAIDGLSTVTKAILDPADGTNKTILIQTKGVDNTSISVTTLGISQPTATITYGSSQVFVGTAIFIQKIPGGYEYTKDISTLVDGDMYGEAKAAVFANNEAYVILSGADAGELGASGIEINARYRSNAITDGLVRLEVKGQTEMAYSNTFV